jgi:Flavodoxin domain
MRATVVCESAFGNTRKIAEAIAEALDAELLSVEDPLPEIEAIDLLVVGAPTHVHGLPSGRSRQAAVDQGGTGVDPTRGIRDWLAELPHANGQLVATFDTRLENPSWLTGSAAKGIAKRLRRQGFELVAEPESFYVLGTEGPLKHGELERAAEWAETLSRATRESEAQFVGSRLG